MGAGEHPSGIGSIRAQHLVLGHSRCLQAIRDLLAKLGVAVPTVDERARALEVRAGGQVRSGAGSVAPPAFEGELHLSLSSSIAVRCPFATVDAGFAGSDYLTMIGLSLRKAAIVAGSRFR